MCGSDEAGYGKGARLPLSGVTPLTGAKAVSLHFDAEGSFLREGVMPAEAMPPARMQPRPKGRRQINWGLTILAGLTIAAAAPFVGFVILAAV